MPVKKITNFEIACKCGNFESISSLDYKVINSIGWVIDSNGIPVTENNIKDIRCPKCEKERIEKLCNSSVMTDRILGGYYNKYSHKFEDDCLKDLGLTNHPKSKKLLEIASSYSNNYYDKYYFISELSELL